MRPLAPTEMDPNPANPDLPPESTLVIGLLGGIAAGKSTVAKRFAEHGFLPVDADRLAREAMDEPGVTALIHDRFGDRVLAGPGAIDRAALAAVVFADPSALADLEGILHPLVRERIRAALADAQVSGQSVVLDVPLLLEGGWAETCDHCVFLDAAQDIRQERARARGWPKGELARREANQASLEAKRARCQSVVRTDGSLADTRAQVDALVESLRGG